MTKPPPRVAEEGAVVRARAWRRPGGASLPVGRPYCEATALSMRTEAVIFQRSRSSQLLGLTTTV